VQHALTPAIQFFGDAAAGRSQSHDIPPRTCYVVYTASMRDAGGAFAPVGVMQWCLPAPLSRRCRLTSEGNAALLATDVRGLALQVVANAKGGKGFGELLRRNTAKCVGAPALAPRCLRRYRTEAACNGVVRRRTP
jgi:hypothetical protein